MTAPDRDIRFHEEWLGLAQPIEGLVFSVPVLADAPIAPEVRPELTQAFERQLTSAEIAPGRALRAVSVQRSGFQPHMTADAAARCGNALAKYHLTQSFRISCSGNSPFHRVMCIWHGQPALDTPVMDAVDDANHELSLCLGAREGVWAGLVAPCRSERHLWHNVG